MSSQSNGAVIVEFRQIGSDVIATWSGSIDLGTWKEDSNLTAFDGALSLVALYNVNGNIETYSGGVASSLPLIGGVPIQFSVSNIFGGFSGSDFFISGSMDNTAPGSSIYNFDNIGVIQQFADVSLSSIGADSFDNTLAWTSSAGGTNTVSYTTVSSVPEPSSSVLFGLGALSLTIRRRRY